MKATLLGAYDHDTPEWDGIRSRGLGGSEIAAVVGLSPWESPFALHHRKRGTLGKGAHKNAFDWGHRLEPVVCQVWDDLQDQHLVAPGAMYRHAERAWQLAGPDRLLYDKGTDPLALTGILEAKTAHQYDAHEWGHGPEDIPPYYRCQVVWYMDVLGVPVAHLAVLIGGNDYRQYVIPYDADEAAWLRGEGERFWADVLAGKAPPIDGHNATYEAVRKIHPEIDGEDAEIGALLWGEYEITKAAATLAADQHKQAKATVLDAMGQAKYATVDGRRVLRRQPGRGGAVSLQPIPQPRHSPKDAA